MRGSGFLKKSFLERAVPWSLYLHGKGWMGFPPDSRVSGHFQSVSWSFEERTDWGLLPGRPSGCGLRKLTSCTGITLKNKTKQCVDRWPGIYEVSDGETMKGFEHRNSRIWFAYLKDHSLVWGIDWQHIGMSVTYDGPGERWWWQGLLG